MANPNEKRGFFDFLPGFGPEKKPSQKKSRRMAMTVPQVTEKFAHMKRQRRPKDLTKDLQINEFYPEQKERDVTAISEGKRFDNQQWNDWRTIVRNEMDYIRKTTHQSITSGSNLEQQVFKAVWEFRQKHPEVEKSLIVKQVFSDLQKFR